MSEGNTLDVIGRAGDIAFWLFLGITLVALGYGIYFTIRALWTGRWYDN